MPVFNGVLHEVEKGLVVEGDLHLNADVEQLVYKPQKTQDGGDLDSGLSGDKTIAASRIMSATIRTFYTRHPDDCCDLLLTTLPDEGESGGSEADNKSECRFSGFSAKSFASLKEAMEQLCKKPVAVDGPTPKPDGSGTTECCQIDTLLFPKPRGKRYLVRIFQHKMILGGNNFDSEIYYKRITDVMLLPTKNEIFVMVSLTKPVIVLEKEYSLLLAKVTSLDEPEVEFCTEICAEEEKSYDVMIEEEGIADFFGKFLSRIARKPLGTTKAFESLSGSKILNVRGSSTIVFPLDIGLAMLDDREGEAFFCAWSNVKQVHFHGIPIREARNGSLLLPNNPPRCVEVTVDCGEHGGEKSLPAETGMVPALYALVRGKVAIVQDKRFGEIESPAPARRRRETSSNGSSRAASSAAALLAGADLASSDSEEEDYEDEGDGSEGDGEGDEAASGSGSGEEGSGSGSGSGSESGDGSGSGSGSESEGSEDEGQPTARALLEQWGGGEDDESDATFEPSEAADSDDSIVDGEEETPRPAKRTRRTGASSARSSSEGGEEAPKRRGPGRPPKSEAKGAKEKKAAEAKKKDAKGKEPAKRGRPPKSPSKPPTPAGKSPKKPATPGKSPKGKSPKPTSGASPAANGVGPDGQPVKRGRGRPKGSKNKPKDAAALAAAAASGKRGPGRPRKHPLPDGATPKKKPAEETAADAKKSAPKPPADPLSGIAPPATTPDGQPVKRKRGRPPGSGKKQRALALLQQQQAQQQEQKQEPPQQENRKQEKQPQQQKQQQKQQQHQKPSPQPQQRQQRQKQPEKQSPRPPPAPVQPPAPPPVGPDGQPIKRKRGRPRKHPLPAAPDSASPADGAPPALSGLPAAFPQGSAYAQPLGAAGPPPPYGPPPLPHMGPPHLGPPPPYMGPPPLGPPMHMLPPFMPPLSGFPFPPAFPHYSRPPM